VAVRTAQTLRQFGVGLLALVAFGSFGRGFGAVPSLIVVAVVFLILLVVIGLMWATWWRYHYGIVGTDLLIVEGLLVRKRRTIPIARVHGVNVRAGLFMRILGLVEVVVQTAGGGAGEPEAKIGAIPLDRAEELRNALLHDAPESALDTPAAPDPVGRISDFRGVFGGAEVRGRGVRFEHKFPFGRLLVGVITSNRVPIIIAVGLGALSQFYEIAGDRLIGETAARAAATALPVLIPVIFAAALLLVAAAAGVGIARDFGFVARRYDTRIEIEAGLLGRRQISIPVRRIQAVRIEESWIRRLLGLAAVHVDTAGLERGGQQGQQIAGSRAMVPVARADEVDGLLHGLLPESEVFPQALRVPARAVRHYLLVPTLLATIIALAALGPTGWFIYRPALPWAMAAVVLVALFAAGVRALEWRRAGVGTDEDAVVFRSGALGSRRVRLTRSRIQSLDVRQSPLQRRAHLASLRTVSVSGSSRATYGVAHLEQAEALRILRWYEDGLARPSRLARSTVEFRGTIAPVSRITRTEAVDLGETDLAEIHDLRTRAPDFFEEVGDPLPTLESFQADLDDLPDGYSRADEAIYRAYDDGSFGGDRVAGYAEVLRGFPQEGRWTIGILLVAAELRGAGVGRAVVDAIAGDARAAGVTALVVGVISTRERSLAFWRREGFNTEVRRRPIAIGNVEAEVVRLERSLAIEPPEVGGPLSCA